MSAESEPFGILHRRVFLIPKGALIPIGSPCPPPIDSVKIPLIHITDLYHPPQDPDDHFDLATVAALQEYDLLGVILDVTEKFLHPAPRGFDISRDPGFVPVVQFASLLGRTIPVAIGPTGTLKSSGDTASDRPIREKAGIELLLDLVRTSKEPVTVSVVGSTRVLAAAFNREPDLVRKGIRAVLLNAGTSAGSREEWNVGLDRVAYIDLWKSGLPIHWYPCTNEKGAFNEAHERGTYWRATHAELLRDVPAPLEAWFRYALTASNRGDILHALDEGGKGYVWENVLHEKRNMWSTASLIAGAGRMLARTPEGWRFVPSNEARGSDSWPMSLEPIAATISDGGVVTWRPAAEPAVHRIFKRQEGRGYGAAMAEALNALLRTIVC